MPFQDLQSVLRIYIPAFLLDDIMPKHLRHSFRLLSGFLSALLFIPMLAGIYLHLDLFPHMEKILQGMFFVFFAFWLDLFLYESFYNSYYFKDIVSVLPELGLNGRSVAITYTAGEIVYHTDVADVTKSFVHSSYGSSVLRRLGIDKNGVDHFLEIRKDKIGADRIVFPGNIKVSAPVYAGAVFTADKEFSQFLFALSIQDKEFIGASEWVANIEDRAKKKARFWGKDNLGKIPGIGKTWSYGQIFTLKQYSEEFEFGISGETSDFAKEIEELEGILARERGANALIVSSLGSGELDVVYGLVGAIQAGSALPALEHKRVFRLNGNELVDSFGEKARFETEFTKILNEAVAAGNIVIVFEDLPAFLANAKNIGTDAASLLYPYLSASSIQIIATADISRFHSEIEGNAALMNSFEIIRMEEKDEKGLISLLENEIAAVEGRTGLFFTYQAVEAIAESAARFFSEGVAIDKAKDLLLEIPAIVRDAKRDVVLKSDVLSLVEAKTGVPTEGNIKGDEKEKLLNLEKTLHERVVGQDEAVAAIANAMRRARAGLRNPNRPIGSFLFLGPTGVGKTETAKALSEIFFGAKLPMMRLDMSEYAGDDALTRLIGSFEGGKAGTLATMLRDQKYGVLLLDEFEKTTSEVMNLFLQVLDEGMFSDMFGKKINARNVIIIATSNAGSDLIFKMVEQGKDLEKEKSGFIDSLVASGKFKPELLNRFDGVILFHPLERNQLTEIAKLAAEKLAKQLREQGIDLRVNNDLIQFLSKEGFDPKFGARPMQRVLQEHVEKLLADKIIRGEIKKGASIEIIQSPTSLESLEVREVSV